MTFLTREQVLAGGYIYPHYMFDLLPTKHVLDRLEERGIGLECIPTKVRVTKNNIHSGKTWNGRHLASVVIKLPYNTYRDLYLCVNPWDFGLKSLWFRKNKQYENRKSIIQGNTEQTVRDDWREDYNGGNTR